MRNSEIVRAVIVLLAGAALPGCGSYGDPCLRTTDCNAGFICSEGRCIVDLGDSPSDASAPPSDASTTPGDSATTSDGKGPTDTSVSSDKPTTSDGNDDADDDATGPDAKNDGRADASPDIGNEASVDAADARAFVDSMTPEGGDADVGIPRDSGTDGDASDAAGAG